MVRGGGGCRRKDGSGDARDLYMILLKKFSSIRAKKKSIDPIWPSKDDSFPAAEPPSDGRPVLGCGETCKELLDPLVMQISI